MEMLHYLMRNPMLGESVEFNDNRLSLYSAQKGKCAITGEYMGLEDIICIRKVPKSAGGTDKYDNLILVCRKVAQILRLPNAEMFNAELEKLNLDAKRLKKLKTLRNLAFVESC